MNLSDPSLRRIVAVAAGLVLVPRLLFGQEHATNWEGTFTSSGGNLDMSLSIGRDAKVQIEGLEASIKEVRKKKARMSFRLFIRGGQYDCALKRQESTGGYHGPCTSAATKKLFAKILIFPVGITRPVANESPSLRPGTVSTCGNNVIESGESCDGNDLGDNTCTSLNKGNGTLGCSETCTFDFSGCAGE